MIILIFILKVLFFPTAVACLLLTALIEVVTEPDWDYWWSANSGLISFLPFPTGWLRG